MIIKTYQYYIIRKFIKKVLLVSAIFLSLIFFLNIFTEIKFLEKYSCPGHTHPQDAFEFSDPAGGHIQRPLTELLFDSWLCNFDNFIATRGGT